MSILVMPIHRILPVAAVMAAAALLASGCGASSSAATPPSKHVASAPATSAAATTAATIVTGKLDEWSVAVDRRTAKAGKVTFDIANDGKIPHEFVVLRTGRPAAKLGTATKIPETGNVGETGDIAPGASKSVTLTLKPGHYALVCNIPGHYMSGMRTDLTLT